MENDDDGSSPSTPGPKLSDDDEDDDDEQPERLPKQRRRRRMPTEKQLNNSEKFYQKIKNNICVLNLAAFLNPVSIDLPDVTTANDLRKRILDIQAFIKYHKIMVIYGYIKLGGVLRYMKEAYKFELRKSPADFFNDMKDSYGYSKSSIYKFMDISKVAINNPKLNKVECSIHELLRHFKYVKKRIAEEPRFWQ